MHSYGSCAHFNSWTRYRDYVGKCSSAKTSSRGIPSGPVFSPSRISPCSPLASYAIFSFSMSSALTLSSPSVPLHILLLFSLYPLQIYSALLLLSPGFILIFVPDFQGVYLKKNGNVQKTHKTLKIRFHLDL